jgi:hypothetical protein
MASLVGLTALLLIVDPGSALAAFSSSSSRMSSHQLSSSSSSRRSSFDRSSRRSSRNDNSDNYDSEDNGRGRSSRSRSSRSSSRRSSSHRSYSSRSSSHRSSKPPVPRGIILGSKYERPGVHPRGELISADAFKALPCARETAKAGKETFYRCGSTWYQRISHQGWIVYSNIWPPAGLHRKSLPDGYETLRGGDGKTYYATDDAFYKAINHDGKKQYVVIEPPVGLHLDHLPDGAKAGIPIFADGSEYYKHVGVFFRKVEGKNGSSWVTTASPFAGIAEGGEASTGSSTASSKTFSSASH